MKLFFKFEDDEIEDLCILALAVFCVAAVGLILTVGFHLIAYFGA